METLASQSDLLATDEAAQYLKSTARTLERWRLTGVGPKFVKIGRKVVYRVRDLEAWLSERTRQGTKETAHAAA